MIVIFALLGFVTGWLLNIAADYLVRFASIKGDQVIVAIQPPALLRLLRRETGGVHFVAQVAVELFIGSLFALLYVLHDVSGETLRLMVFGTFFALITIMDYKYRLVLNVLTYPGIVLALIMNLFVLRQPALHILLGVVFAFGLFYVTALIRPNSLGGGDIKVAALIGAIFGFPQVLWALIASAAASAIVIAALLSSHRLMRKDTIPYTPFLCLGAVIVLIYRSAFIG